MPNWLVAFSKMQQPAHMNPPKSTGSDEEGKLLACSKITDRATIKLSPPLSRHARSSGLSILKYPEVNCA